MSNVYIMYSIIAKQFYDYKYIQYAYFILVSGGDLWPTGYNLIKL